MSALTQDLVTEVAQSRASLHKPQQLAPMQVVQGRKRAYFTTSWDDGHPLDLKLADLLAEYALPGTFYVPVHSHHPRISDSEMRRLSSSFEIGAHTITHCDLFRTTDQQARSEIVDCRLALQDVTGTSCESFCFPKGHFRRKHLPHVAEAGYSVARTVELMSMSAPRETDGVALVPTTVLASVSGLLQIAKNSLKRMRISNLITYVSMGERDWTRVSAAAMAHVITNGGVFHLWGHSWEIEAQNQWAQLESVLAGMAAYRERAEFVSNGALAPLTIRSADEHENFARP